jgi:hypothetical protein
MRSFLCRTVVRSYCCSKPSALVNSSLFGPLWRRVPALSCSNSHRYQRNFRQHRWPSGHWGRQDGSPRWICSLDGVSTSAARACGGWDRERAWLWLATSGPMCSIGTRSTGTLAGPDANVYQIVHTALGAGRRHASIYSNHRRDSSTLYDCLVAVAPVIERLATARTLWPSEPVPLCSRSLSASPPTISPPSRCRPSTRHAGRSPAPGSSGPPAVALDAPWIP